MASIDAAPGTPVRGRVVVLEDDASVQHMLRTILRLERYEVEGFSNGRAALQSVEESPPDLLVADLVVPEPDGWEVVRRLRAGVRTQSLPILLISSVQELAAESEKVGASDYLAKPFRVQQLLAKLDTLLATPAAPAP
ncbi:MAG: response regulator [Dehalococcoidia bacterium]